jgi:hypothetical protein
MEHGDEGKISWDKAIDEIIRISLRMDFNLDNIRGRGAWREKDGRVCYHDGVETIGEPDKKRLYMRKARVNIGLSNAPLELETRKIIKDLVFEMSFETKVDAVRALGWTTLAPFAGALKWRPSILVTGDSESGKTTLVDKVIKPLSVCMWFNGDTTPAAIKGKTNKDSYPIFIDEAEGEEGKKKMGIDNRTELFKIMRISSSDDSPDTGKGTKDGGYRSSKMINMFGFNAIDPTIENVADENRIFRVNMVKSTNRKNWKTLEKKIDTNLTEENCKSLRAFTWSRLKDIFKMADRITDLIMDINNKGYRSCYAEGLLCGAYIVVWSGNENPTDKKLKEFLDDFYKLQPPEETRHDAEEIVNRLLDEVIEVIHEDRKREKITILEGLKRIHEGVIVSEDSDKVTHDEIRETKLAIGRRGIRILESGEIAICNRHHQIGQIINKGIGYNKLFKRHKGFVEASRSVTFPDKSRRCTIIKGIIKTKEDEDLEKLVF